jgi:peptide/nickel transport system substrate-binding protein
MVTIAQADVRLDDPHLTTDNRDRLGIRGAVYEALVARNDDGSYAPAIAASWHVAPDAREWRLLPRDDVRFHDGSRCGTAEIVASLERARSPERGGELGTTGVIQGYLADARIDSGADGSVRIVTAEPMADLLDLLVDIPIIPRASLEEATATPAGSGPYRVIDVDDGVIGAVRFERYWGRPPVHAEVRWVREPNPRARADRLLDGDVDLVSDLATADRDRVLADPRLRVADAPSPTAVAFICNAAAGVCADRRVRRALSQALDVEALIRITGNDGARPLNGPLTSWHLGYDRSVPAYAHDPRQARALLAAAGHLDGIRLVLDVPTRLPDEGPVLGAVLAEQFAGVGVDTDVRLFADRSAYAEMVRAKRIADACCFDSTPLSTFRVLREKVHGGVRGPWWQGFHDPRVDRLLDQAAATVDLPARQVLYRRAYRLIRDEAPWLFLYSPRFSWGAAAETTWRPRPAGTIGLV